MFVMINGVLCTEAMIPLNDRGFQLGDGFFTTLFVSEGSIHFWAEHLERLQRSAHIFKMRVDFSGLQDHVLETVAANTLMSESVAVRMTVTRGTSNVRGVRPAVDIVPCTIIQVWPYHRPTTPVSLDFSRIVVPKQNILSYVKHLGYQRQILGQLEAQEKQVDDVIFCNDAGHIVSTTSANIFIRIQERVYTPHVESGCLPGIMRSHMIQSLRAQGVHVEEGFITTDQLLQAQSIFLTNSLIGARPALLHRE